MNKIKYFSKLLEIYIFTVLFCNFSYGLEPITPDDVFTQSEIVKIIGEENFFYLSKWMKKLQYGGLVREDIVVTFLVIEQCF